MQKLILFVVVVGVVALVAFHRGHQPAEEGQHATIAEIAEAPNGYDGKSVIVDGVVAAATGILGDGAYWLRQPENSSEILIVTGAGVPPTGAKVVVRGKVKQALVIGRVQYAVIIEGTRDDGKR